VQAAEGGKLTAEEGSKAAGVIPIIIQAKPRLASETSVYKDAGFPWYPLPLRTNSRYLPRKLRHQNDCQDPIDNPRHSRLQRLPLLLSPRELHCGTPINRADAD
jgi:hypothetical protein